MWGDWHIFVFVFCIWSSHLSNMGRWRGRGRKNCSNDCSVERARNVQLSGQAGENLNEMCPHIVIWISQKGINVAHFKVLEESLAFGPCGSIDARTRFRSVFTRRRPRIDLWISCQMSMDGSWTVSGTKIDWLLVSCWCHSSFFLTCQAGLRVENIWVRSPGRSSNWYSEFSWWI